MAESIYIPETSSRLEAYEALLPQIEALISDETDGVANLANVAAVLKQAFDFFWVGFYRVQADSLVLGPFQGPVACTRIAFDKGVCGACYREGQTILVPNVDEFPGHIACSSDSKSEIVVPIFKEGRVALILDVDSDQLNDFGEEDQQGLEKLAELLGKYAI